MRVKLPRLLNGGMKKVRALHPSKLSITKNLEPPHEATMTLPDDERLKIRDWVELFDKGGSVGIFRVNSLGQSFGNGNTYGLSHGFSALRDATVKGEGELSGTAAQIIGNLLPWQTATAGGAPLWVLGDTVNTGNIVYEYTNPNLQSAILEVMAKAGGYALAFDQSALPWRLSIVKLSDEDACEGRFGRNLQSADISVDDSDLYTRVEFDDRDGYTDADTVNDYGVVNKVIIVPEGATEESITRHVDEFLEAHKQPTTTIELDGVDMSAATGESLDAFALGKVCRACLPEYGTTVRARITSIETSDVLGDPEGVRIGMANRAQTVSDILTLTSERTSGLESSSVRTSRRVGGVSSRVDENEIELYKSKLELIEYQGQTAERFNEVFIDLKEAEAQIQLKASQTDFNTALSRISAAEVLIDGANAAIELNTSYIETVDGRTSAAEAQLKVQAGEISTKVSKNGVISSINQTAEEVRIQASKINLSGYVTASQLSAEVASLKSTFSHTLSTTNLYAAGSFTFQGWGIHRSSMDVVTSVRLSKGATTVPGANGINYYVINSVSISVDKDTISYLGY